MAGVLVAGGSHAAVAAVMALRTAGYPGPIRLISAEDLPPYHRPPLSKEAITAERPSSTTPLRPASYYTSHEIELTLGRTVCAIDRVGKSVELSDRTRLPYDQLILALGARARELPASVCDPDTVPTLRTHRDYLTFMDRLATAQSLIVIGAGLIGLEIAAGAVRRGIATTVIDTADRVMIRTALSPVSDHVKRHHERSGLSFRLNTQIHSVSRKDGSYKVSLASGEMLCADVVLAAIGSRPEDHLAHRAGLSTGDGVLASATGQTDDPAIFALGDCAAWFDPALGRHVRREAIQPAQDQARVVASMIVGLPQPTPAVPRAWSHQSALRIQMAGEPSAAARSIHHPRPDGGLIALGLSGDQIVAAQAVNVPNVFNALADLVGQPEAAAEAVLSSAEPRVPA
ncbi:NAD(P)/FAD-dependent oxidoreductase [Microvirga sp. VF16]|uniref:NAD(P)/FAD-dependent oxidoreductase n=1 Tax=Microvirga sp. VF16 TaxID=2807101 RepID=UPI00193CA250|nr:FAD-dependent oxidoreductase [Microvirga sp. VF16]QRM27615.1 FAD-dependent oxidoreductase [Microvirga sp. VF16]